MFQVFQGTNSSSGFGGRTLLKEDGEGEEEEEAECTSLAGEAVSGLVEQTEVADLPDQQTSGNDPISHHILLMKSTRLLLAK